MNLTEENRQKMLSFWLFISSFGIMFAVLSWFQEAGILPSVSIMGFWKGLFAVFAGLPLYWLVARNIPGGAADD